MQGKSTGDISPCVIGCDVIQGATDGHVARTSTKSVLGATEDYLPGSGERPAELIVRQRAPDNLEFPFSTLNTDCLLTPNEQFFVRTHFEVPALDARTWRLSVQGEVERSRNHSPVCPAVAAASKASRVFSTM